MKEGKPYLLLVPALVIFGLFMLWPTLYTFYLSFFDWNLISPTKTFVGLGNYVAVLKDPVMIKVMGNTLAYLLILLVFNFLVPYVLAFVLHHVIAACKDFFKSAFFMPSFISMVVGSIIYSWMLNPTSGPLAEIVSCFGLEIPNWSQSNQLVLVVICYIVAWKVFGYNFITLYAAIASVDEEVIESAKLDRVPNWRIFKDIIVPMTSSSAFYILVMTIVTGLQYVYTPVSVITQGGPDNASTNLIYESYKQAFILFDTGESAALSMFTLLIFSILLFINLKVSEKGVYYVN